MGSSMKPTSESVEVEYLMTHAQTRYGDFASMHEALGVACEEWDELRAAIHSNKLESVRDECLDLAAVLIRLASQIRTNDKLRERSGK
jgi:NTP pyrophosphatase (non-canonical NTP hydrolase)